MNFDPLDPQAYGFGFDFTPAPPPCDPRAERRQLGRLALAVAAIPVISTLAQLVISLVLVLAFPNGVKLPEESLKGGDGLGEIGFRRSDAHSPWSLEGRLRGYVGEREGVSGMMSATWRF